MLTSPSRLSKRPLTGAETSDLVVVGLSAVSTALVESAPPASLETALNVLSSSFELRGASLALFESDGPDEVVLDSWSRGQRSPALLALAHEAARRVRATQMPLVVENAWVELSDRAAIASSWHDADLDASLVGVPVRRDGTTIGSLAIVREHSAGDQAAFCFDSDVTVLGSVANLVGLALRVDRLQRHAESTARACAVSPVGPPCRTGKPEANGARVPIGTAAPWRAVLQKIQSAARSTSTVLLRGETGVGKSMIARALHDASPRRDRPFVVLNCSGLTETLLESELFGHEKGAFTGALAQRSGRFELADGGTLFLDEIGEISASFQAKLLRVLQEGEFERVGGTTTQHVDVRIVAATHRDLEAAVRAGTFRADLYYRLCVVPIRVPALRERREDIAPLARAFLERFNAENDTDRAFGTSAIDALVAYSFPGNVRELENAVRRAASLATRQTLTADDFSFLREGNSLAEEQDLAPLGFPTSPPTAPHGTRPIDGSSEEGGRLVERERLLQALEKTGWVMAKAARLLEMTPRQVGYAVHRYGIVVRKF
jgi:Nif-specific regulatory protein